MSNFEIDKFLSDFLIAIENVGIEYYKIKTTYDPKGIVRERVFCYELYHQFRSLPSKSFPYAFHGELDKRGHVLIEPEEQKIPDFLVHTPGSMDGNKVIVEVKGKIFANDIVADIKKIYNFITEVKYEYGVFLLFNHSFEELQSEIAFTTLNQIDSRKDKNIFILCSTPRDGIITINNLSDLREGLV